MEDGEFIAIVKDELEEIKRGRGLNEVGDQFSVWFATNILDEDESDAAEVYRIGGGGDNKIDIGIYDDDHDIIVIAQCKYSSTPQSKSYSRDIVDEARNALHRIVTDPNSGSERRKAFASRVKEALDSDSHPPIHLISVGFGKVDSGVKTYAIEQGVDLYDYTRVKECYEYLMLPGHEPEPDLVSLSLSCPDIAPCIHRGDGFEMWTFMCQIGDIYEGVKEYKDRFFQKNLRYRLEGKQLGKIGQLIQTTILENPDRLAALNNGLTIVCSDATFEEGRANLVHPQIVNGGQTAWAIADACTKLAQGSRSDEMKSPVLVRAIKTVSAELIDTITEATNTQNPVTERDKKANDSIQTSIKAGFHSFEWGGTPYPILYEQKKGDFHRLRRVNEHGQYRVRGKLYRRIDNERAGQLLLALLELPHFCKAQKRLIFENDTVYRTVYDYRMAREDRFMNDDIGISPDDVRLRSGSVRAFAEDVVFASGVYALVEAYKRAYMSKLGSYIEAERETDMYKRVAAHEFLKMWHYYVVAALHHIVESHSGDNDSTRNDLRRRLIGDNMNRLFEPDLHGSFNVNQDKGKYVVLDEQAPSTEFPLFAKWITSLTSIMYKMFKNAKEEPDWKSARHYLDLRSETYEELIDEIDDVIGGPSQVVDVWFPQVVRKP